MRKFYVLGLALFSVFAFGAISAGSAFAALEWLVEKAAFAGSLNAETEGTINLVKLSSSLGPLNTIKCEGILDGVITFPSTGLVTKVLNLAMEETGTPLSGLSLLCIVTEQVESADCKLGTSFLLWPINLPWTTELELMEITGEEVLDHIVNAGYEVECETGILGIHASETCEGLTSTVMTNGFGTPPGVVGTFNANSEAVNCSMTGAGTGLQTGSGTLWAIGAELERLETAIDHS